MKRLLALLVALSSPLVADDEYDLHLHRIRKAGEKFTVAITAGVDAVTTISAQNRVVRENKISVLGEVEGELEIVAVSPKGKVTEAKLKISKARTEQDDKPAELFKVNDVIYGKPGDKGKNVFLINAQAASPAQAELAGLLVPLGSATDVTDDDVFGPGRKVKIGDSWPVNSAAAAKDSAALGEIKAENIKGTAKAQRIEEVAGQKCVNVRLDVTTEGSGFSVPNAPQQVKVKNMKMEMIAEGQIPIDGTGPLPNEKQAITIDMAAGGEVEQNGQKIQLGVSVHRKQMRQGQTKIAK